MGCSCGSWSGLAIWHFTVFLPDRFWAGSSARSSGRCVGAFIFGLLFNRARSRAGRHGLPDRARGDPWRADRARACGSSASASSSHEPVVKRRLKPTPPKAVAGAGERWPQVALGRAERGASGSRRARSARAGVVGREPAAELAGGARAGERADEAAAGRRTRATSANASRGRVSVPTAARAEHVVGRVAVGQRRHPGRRRTRRARRAAHRSARAEPRTGRARGGRCRDRCQVADRRDRASSSFLPEADRRALTDPAGRPRGHALRVCPVSVLPRA